jgi:hypothetical protein
LNEVIIHFQTGWQLSISDLMPSEAAIEADVRNFFKLPIPLWVWRETRQARDPEFVAFIESCLSESVK